VIDKNLKVLYEEMPHPTEKETIKYECCNNTKIVYDNRFNEYYTCPKCCGKLELITRKQRNTIPAF
jgi:hypothetical protein